MINVSQTTNWIISWIINLQYDTTVDQLKKIRDEIEDYVKTHEDFNTEVGYAVRIDKFAESSIDMYVRCFTKTNEWEKWLSVKERLAIQIKQIVEKMAAFAFPSQSIYVEKNDCIILFSASGFETLHLCSYCLCSNKLACGFQCIKYIK